jgi:hypothetical protein
VRTFTTPSKKAGWWELGRRFIVFWCFTWDACKIWGLVREDAFMPYDWRFYMGPICLARITGVKPRKLSRQERRALLRRARKQDAAR